LRFFDYASVTYYFDVYPVLKSHTGIGGIFYFFSIVMYYIAITGSNPINSSIPFKMGAKNTHQVILLKAKYY
jgi:hypothetical protein